jgi:glycosyltransferase involved in cell wall biosynthesis
MACGVPVVATDVGDARAIVHDLGEIVPARDPAALAAAIDRCIPSSPERRHKLGAAGRERIVARSSLAAMVARSEALLVETLAAAQPARTSRPVELSTRIRDE